ncbi:MAG TPA: sugar ABC transporter permease [Dongiaceae bacterium]|jgi:ABC-type sugar transport system permease subunit|nr:sugar ABC transporter permease [Dongiaceae bacterium]
MRINRWLPWVYAAPMMLFVGVIFAYPIVSLLHYSLSVPGAADQPAAAGLGNYGYVLSDPLFHTALLNNLELFLCVPVMLALSVILSAILFDRPRGWRVYRTMLFIPYILSIPTVGFVFGYIFQYQGALNAILRMSGMGFLAADWLGSPAWAMRTIMFVIIWKELGFGVILCLARLVSVSEEYFESARVDGAGWWQILWHVTIPQLAPALAFYGIVELINMLSWVFAYVYVMTLGGPMNSTVVTEYYIYQQVFTNDIVGVGSAAGVVLLSIVSVLIAMRIWMQRRLAAGGFE